MKTQPASIHQQLNAIYPSLHRQPVVSSASRAIIEEALREDRGLGTGRHIAIVLSLAAVMSVIPTPALATIVVNNGQTTDNKILAGVHYEDPSDDGWMEVHSGGLATNTTIHSGGWQLLSGGSTIYTTINYLGQQYVYSGGEATSTTLNSSGEQ